MANINETDITSSLQNYILVLISVISLSACSKGASSYSGGNTPQTPITISVVPSRTSGVAPLSVFFDAFGTTATATTTPFHNLEYRWNFGDTTAGTWAYGAKPGTSSKSLATGPEAAHVFETPGTYTVTMNAFDGTNTSGITTTITVQDPNIIFSGSNTICINQTNSDFTGCPAGADTHIQPDFPTALNTYAITGKRVLFKRGDTFTGTTSAALTHTGPGMVGAYGTGANPIIHTTSTSGQMFTIGDPSVNVMQDWRVMDLEFDGQSNAGITVYSAAYNADQMLFLIVNMHDAGNLYIYNTGILNIYQTTMHIWSENFLVDSVLQRAIGGAGAYVAFVAGAKMVYLGNLVNDSTGAEHVMRIMYSAKGIFSNNTFSNPAPTKQVFTLRGISYSGINCTGGAGTSQCLPSLFPYNTYAAKTTQTVVSDNKFISGNTSQPVDIHPSESNLFDTEYEDILFERNWYVSTVGGCCIPMLNIQAQKVTVRNEVMEISAGDWHRAFAVSGAGTASPASSDVRIYNNTIYSSASNQFQAAVIDAGVTGVIFKNNIFYAPNINGTVDFTNATASNNSTDTRTNAYFTAVPPTSPPDFKITTGSYAIGTGTTVPVWSNFFLVPQTAISSRDLGAVTHQ